MEENHLDWSTQNDDLKPHTDVKLTVNLFSNWKTASIKNLVCHFFFINQSMNRQRKIHP